MRSKLLAKFPPAVGEPIPDEGIGPPPEIPLEVICETIFSGRRGAGPGPDGIRGDFLRDIMGFESDQEPIGKVLQAFVQLLADGNVPTYLRPFLGGGHLVGIGKKDLAGNPISLDSDARPIVLGLTWRKVVFKATLALDRRGIRERLGDQQLALTKAGADVMVHAARAWVTRNLQNNNVVLLQKDVRNAFNELKP